MHMPPLTRVAGAIVAAGLATSCFAAGVSIAPMRNQSETAAVAQMNPPILNWAAPQYFNPQRGLYSSFGLAGAKAARTLATFVPVTPCRLVDTRGLFSPVYAGGAFTQASGTETRTYQAKGNCGVPNVNNAILGVSIAVTTLPNNNPGDVEVIPGNVTPGSTVLMVVAQGIWNSATTVVGLDSTGNFKVQMRFIAGATPTHMALDVNGYYTVMDPGNVGDYFSIVGDSGATGKGLLDIVQTGAVGAALRATGGGGADVRLAEGSTAIDVASGDVRASGGSDAFAFVHTTAASNICDGTSGLDAHYTRLTGNTQVFSASANLSTLMLFAQQRGSGTTKPVSTVYVGGLAHCTALDTAGNGWYLFNNASTFGAGETFAIMVIHP